MSNGIWRPLKRPTESARVFSLSPALQGSRIEIQLHSISLYQHVEYDCISYTWGDDCTTTEIHINGQSHRVRRHLWNCLNKLRLEHQARLLWADAICINQEDLIEKAHQVSIIGKIFSKAIHTFAWLGEEAEGSEAVMQAASTGFNPVHRAAFHVRLWNRTRKLCGGDVSLTDYVSAEDKQNVRDIEQAWRPFICRPYWRRTWIIQEVLLSHQVTFICGDKSISGDKFFALHKIIDRHHLNNVPDPELDFFHNRSMVAQLDLFRPRKASFYVPKQQSFQSHSGARLRYSSVMTTLSWLLSSFRNSCCSDPRDKIYALLPLTQPMSEQEASRPVVDYQIDTIELFFRTIVYLRECREFVTIDVVRRALDLTEDEVAAGLDARPKFLEGTGWSRDLVIRGGTVWPSFMDQMNEPRRIDALKRRYNVNDRD